MSENEEKQDNEEVSEETNAVSWQIYAYPHYDRGALWFVLAGIAGGGLLIAALLTNNFLLAAIIVMVGVVIIVQGTARPPLIDVEIGEMGIRRGDSFINFRSISRFWIVYDPPIKSLYLNVPRSLFSTVRIPIDDQDPSHLRELLKKHVKEDLERDHEPLSDSISRIFKI